MSVTPSITIHSAPGHAGAKVATLSGEMDETFLPTLEKTLDPLAAQPAVKQVVFDLTDLVFVNSKVIGYIASFYSSLKQGEKSLFFAVANETIRDILSLVGLTAIIPQFDTLDQALASLK